MANQIIIDIGAVANDGTGDPLRTAFGYVNNNFSNIWATGVANSNVAFDGNRILTTNTNGNLVLAPNGIGKIQANVDIVPSANNAQSLGSLTRQWNTVYAQNLSVGGNVEFNSLTVDGNLTVTGNIIQIGNLVTDSKTIQLANTAVNANAANGSGITVGANDNIATMLYSSSSNVWNTNIGITATGNITAPYFVGDGSLLTGITSYGNSNVAAYLPVYTGNISANNVFVTNDVYSKRGSFSGDPVTGDASIYVGSPTFTNLGTDVMAQFTGNVTNYAQINLQNYGNSPTSSGDYIITADNGTDSTHFLNLGLTGSNWDGTQPNSLGNRLGPNDGYLYVQDGDMVIGTSNGNIETWKFDQTGNLTVPGYITQGNAKIGLNENSAGAVYLTAVTDDITGLIINTENAQLYANDYVSVNAWTFENSGNLTTSDLVLYESGDNFVISWDNEELILRSVAGDVDVEADNGFNIRVNYDGGANDYLTKWVFAQDNEIVNITGNSAIVTEAGNLNLQGGRNTLSSGNVQITAVDNGVAVNTWTFDNTGNLTLPGNISGNTAGFAIGYRDIPQVSFTGNATIATTDAGKHFYSTQSSNYILTIANNASQGFQVGAAITVVNQGTGTITIAQGADVTLYLAGNATSGNRSVATFGMATIMKVATDTWFINGTGVS